MKNWVSIGAISSAIAVVCGAFGAHGLRDHVSAEDLAIWQTGVLYHLIHAPALVLYGLVVREGKQFGGWCFFLGTLIFSGSLYAMTLGAPRWFGAITPIGGVLLIVGWFVFAWEARRRLPRPD